MRCFKLLAFVVVTLLFYAATAPDLQAQVPAPRWMSALSEDFTDKSYLAFLANGPSLQAAREDGLAQIARYFGVEVTALSEGNLSYNERGNESLLESRLSQSVEARSRQDLFAVEYSSPYQQGASIWLVAWIKRETLSLTFEAELSSCKCYDHQPCHAPTGSRSSKTFFD